MNTNGIEVIPLLSHKMKYEISVEALFLKLKKNMKESSQSIIINQACRNNSTLV